MPCNVWSRSHRTIQPWKFVTANQIHTCLNWCGDWSWEIIVFVAFSHTASWRHPLTTDYSYVMHPLARPIIDIFSHWHSKRSSLPGKLDFRTEPGKANAAETDTSWNSNWLEWDSWRIAPAYDGLLLALAQQFAEVLCSLAIYEHDAFRQSPTSDQYAFCVVLHWKRCISAEHAKRKTLAECMVKQYSLRPLTCPKVWSRCHVTSISNYSSSNRMLHVGKCMTCTQRSLMSSILDIFSYFKSSWSWKRLCMPTLALPSEGSVDSNLDI